MTAAEIARALNGKKSGDDWSCHCPAHDDKTASLSIAAGKDRYIVLHCHAGCSSIAVIDALKRMKLWPSGDFNIAAAYDYRDETGRLRYQVVRLDPKSFRQRRPDGA